MFSGARPINPNNERSLPKGLESCECIGECPCRCEQATLKTPQILASIDPIQLNSGLPEFNWKAETILHLRIRCLLLHTNSSNWLGTLSYQGSIFARRACYPILLSTFSPKRKPEFSALWFESFRDLLAYKTSTARPSLEEIQRGSALCPRESLPRFNLEMSVCRFVMP
jgi:hypothetical protein